ncbi:MAG TPA: ABC transporter ATP-binding protein [Candidatus Mcinerneyibacterium sp.]|nr:ABC transporter ATP-binding protein [Candidatus Mcinerneyibacterium sp.]
MNKRIIKTLSYFAKKNPKEIIIGGISLIVLSFLALPQPLITRYLIDHVLIDGQNLQMLAIMIGLFLAVAIFQNIFEYLNSFYFGLLDEKILLEMEIKLFKKIQYAKNSSLKNWKKGYLISRIKDDVSSFSNIFFPSLMKAAKQILTLLVGLVAVFYLNWKLALVSVFLYPLFIYLIIYYNKKIRKVSSEYYEARSNKMGTLTEGVNLVSVFKNLSREAKNVIRYFKSSRETFNKSIKKLKITVNNEIILGFVLSLIPVMVFAYGGYLIIKGYMTLGTLIAFNSYMGYVYRPTSSLLNFNIKMQKSLQAWKRIKKVMDLPKEKRDGKIIKNIKRLSLNFISFGYKKDDRILNSIKMVNEKGSILGIVGESGSGKSTILKLITGQLKPDKGTVRINGFKLTNLDIINYRKKIGLINQEPILFNDTIYNNIAIGNKHTEKEDIINAAKKAQIHGFIKSLEEGYQTELKEDSTNISVGQKQRIALARILLKDTDLLLLDEPTSSIDSKSEKKLNNVLNLVKCDKIILIVTHRKKILEICDAIYRLEGEKLCKF